MLNRFHKPTLRPMFEDVFVSHERLALAVELAEKPEASVEPKT